MSNNSDNYFVSPLQKAITTDPLTVTPETILIDAIAIFNQSQTTCLLTPNSLAISQGKTCIIITVDHRPVGILTHRDIVRLIARRVDLQNLTVGAVMTQPVITLQETEFTHLSTTLNLLQQHNIRHLPLVNTQGKLVGLLSHRDLKNSLEPTDLLKLRTIEEVMNSTVVQAPATISLLKLAELMNSALVSCVVLVEERIDNQERFKIPVGLMTEGDILKFQALDLDWNLEAQTVMTTPLFCLKPNDTLLAAHLLMQQYNIHRIPIVGDRGELLGIITPTSILQAINPIDLLELVDLLRQKINHLEAEKVQLLQIQNTKLEEKIQGRTEALKRANQRLQAEIQERSLIESKIALQASLLEQVKNAIIATDLEGTIIYWNHYAQTLYQWTAEDALGNNIIDFVVPLDQQNLAEEIVYEVINTGYWEGEFTTSRKDSSTLPIHVFDTLIRDREGNPMGLVGISFDISERKKAEQQLHQQVQRERLFYQTALHIRQSLNLTDILNNAVVDIREILHCDRVLVYEFDSTFNGTIVAESVGEGWTSCLGMYLEDTCFKTRGAFHCLKGKKTAINNIEEANLSECYQQFLTQFQVKANLVVPISIQDHNQENGNFIWGLLIAHQCFSPRNWHSSELELLDEIAVQLSIGIQQSQLYQKAETEIQERQKIEQELRLLNQELETRILDRTAKLERQERKSRLFAEIALKIRQSLDIDQILQTTVTEVQNILGCDRLLIYRVFDNGTGKTIAESVLPGWDSILNFDFPEEVFPLEYQQLYSNRTVKAIANIHQQYQDITPCLVEFLQAWKIKAKLIVPIIQNHSFWGFMIAHQCVSPRKWTDFEIELMREIADQVGVALEQAQLVETLREREQFIESIADSSPNILYLYDVEQNRSIYNSRSLTTILGYTSLELSIIGDNFSILFHPDDQETVIKHLEETAQMSDREISYVEYRIQHKNGEWLWFSSHATVFKRDSSGNTQQILGVAQNISDRKQAEDNLKRQLAAVEASIDGISILKNEEYIYVNNAHLKLFGYSNPEELLTKNWRVLYTLDVVKWFEKDIFPLLQQQKFWRGETIGLRKDGTTFNQEVSFTVTEDGDYICISQDISERQAALYERQQAEIQLRQTNEQLAIANAELAMASRLKDEFLANMSHELRTPLNSILGMSEVLQEQTFGELNEQQNQALRLIYRNGKHLLELINDILDLSKIEAGKLNLECSPVSANELCQHSLSFVKQQAYQKNIRLSYQIEDVTEALNVDERRMRQVLINLLNNAVKFTPEGGQVRLEVRGDPDEKKVRFSVIDNGIGIALEDQAQLFQVFVQIDSRLSRRYEGTGLGLVLVKKLVEMHGGTVTLDSQPGKGSCFTVALPWTQAPWGESLRLTPAELLDRSALSWIAPSGSKRPLILLAEDNPDNIQTLLNYLQAKGFDLEVARNGIEAVQKANSLHPDLILMDISMPEIDGLEAMRQIRADPQMATLPIIALTAFAMAGDREQCLAAGANEYLPKPVQIRQLVQLIQNFLFESQRNFHE
ncbi:putative Histidine kinase [Planktothrix sp. PCC 11201]|uniref:PAS domain S-box protein n=1 Tax=Planktothrix sp. PCC 11201 TaxID=1729650 RepID=UPI00091DF092|nr:PAS domain S-box protein [Planktothrix sp. PCC 11201]SKB13237.1 putative Histidine kinase [Planktothrix sp. PCC 11201]